jgi:uncharacterized protein YbjT (DUF2867 family)
MKQVLIVGGSGLLGQELVRLLLNKGMRVHVLTRTPNKSSHLNGLGAVVVKGNLADTASLDAACRGMDAVVSAAHSMLGRGRYSSEKIDGEGQKKLVDAAVSAGVKYFLFTSIIGASPNHPLDFCRTKWAVEEHLKQSGMAYNIVRPAAFMEVHIQELMGKSILEKGKVTLLGKGMNPTNFVSIKNVAQLVAHCMDNPQGHNQTYDIGGLDNPTRHDIVKLYEAKIGKPVKVSHVPNGVLRFMSRIIKPFHPGISRILFLSDLFDRTDQTFDVRPLLKTFQIQPLRVTDFIRDI